MDICTNSDHNAVVAKIELDHLITSYSMAAIRKENIKRTVIMYDKATEEDWDSYKQNLDKQLEKRISIQDLERFSQSKEDTRNEENINKWWDAISNSIITIAYKYLPKKKISNTASNKRKKTKEVQLGKTLTQLGRWINIGRKNIKLGYLEDYIEDLNKEIIFINQQHGIYIDLAQESWSCELIKDLKG
jgi:viroplasmin and RNaseH domain-containing protein